MPLTPLPASLTPPALPLLDAPTFHLHEGAILVSGRRKLHGNLYFTTLYFRPGTGDTAREQLRDRLIDTFTGRPARGSVATTLADMADVTSETICAWLDANPSAFAAATCQKDPALA
jgi:hypothetical protein